MKVPIGREERRHGRIGTLLVGLGAGAFGALAAFLADPLRGRARRARLLDQGAATVRRAGREAERVASRIGSMASGKLEAITEGGSRLGPTDDVTLRDRAETELFRDPSVPKGSINLSVERGVLVLRGEVADAGMRERLASQAESIEGVWSVRNLLHLPGEPAEEMAASLS
jgi:osmotically-inducible protein OsmY